MDDSSRSTANAQCGHVQQPRSCCFDFERSVRLLPLRQHALILKPQCRSFASYSQNDTYDDWGPATGVLDLSLGHGLC